MNRYLFALLLCWAGPAPAAEESIALQYSVQELRSAIGEWQVTTEFLKPDGSVGKSVEGIYQFEWVVPDRVLTGRSSMPQLDRQSALLFYIRERTAEIEMVSVGADGKLWVMSGPLGGDTRTTPPYPTAQGGTGQLRFTRYNVSDDAFESKMDFSEDGGLSWLPGNHQRFQRTLP